VVIEFGVNEFLVAGALLCAVNGKTAPATFRPAASNAVAIPSLQAVRRESLGAGMRSGEADFSSGMG
jgi:hypothetical protein